MGPTEHAGASEDCPQARRPVLDLVYNTGGYDGEHKRVFNHNWYDTYPSSEKSLNEAYNEEGGLNRINESTLSGSSSIDRR